MLNVLMIKMINAWVTPNWTAPSSVRAISSTRLGGFSNAPYQGLNLGLHVGDDAQHVMQNRTWLAQQAAMPNPPIWLNQTHSTQVHVIKQPQEDFPSLVLDGDGLVTKLPRQVCAIMTADCLPILITNTQGTQVAAVHAGWRGLAQGIIDQALAHFSQDVLVWLGPAISCAHFEVGAEVRQIFCDQISGADQAFTPAVLADKWYADLYQLARLSLRQQGVEQVFDNGLCTYQDPNRFFSYRRDGQTGRQASFIWIE